MPYYLGEDMEEEWHEYMDQVDADPTWEASESQFKYVEPWRAKTTVLSFPETPGPEPEVPQPAAYRSPPASKPGFFARLFGQKADPAEPHLWKVSRLTATCRTVGVKRVFGSYDGGGDESFTYFLGIEMIDGRVIPAEELGRQTRSVDYDQLVDDAVSALIGRFDAGPFILHGAVIIDFDACTITDEKNIDAVLGDKMPWEV
jgi:hypothetical protein